MLVVVTALLALWNPPGAVQGSDGEAFQPPESGTNVRWEDRRSVVPTTRAVRSGVLSKLAITAKARKGGTVPWSGQEPRPKDSVSCHPKIVAHIPELVVQRMHLPIGEASLFCEALIIWRRTG